MRTPIHKEVKMKYIISIFLMCILLVSCWSSGPVVPVEPFDSAEYHYMTPNQSFPYIAIMPSYKFVGEKDFSDQKAVRRYTIWESVSENKYLMIYQLIVREGEFPSNLEWITEDAIYKSGMKAVYTTIGNNAFKAIDHYGLIIPDCFILAQEIHINEANNEAIFRILIVNDEFCTEDYEPVLEELNRVAITNPLG